MFMVMVLQWYVIILQDPNCLISLGKGGARSQAREHWGQVLVCAYLRVMCLCCLYACAFVLLVWSSLGIDVTLNR